jgi:hypothetical protein
MPQSGKDPLDRGRHGRGHHHRTGGLAEPPGGPLPPGGHVGAGTDPLHGQALPGREHQRAIRPEERGRSGLHSLGLPGTGRHGQDRPVHGPGQARGDVGMTGRLGPGQPVAGPGQERLESLALQERLEQLLHRHRSTKSPGSTWTGAFSPIVRVIRRSCGKHAIMYFA